MPTEILKIGKIDLENDQITNTFLAEFEKVLKDIDYNKDELKNLKNA